MEPASGDIRQAQRGGAKDADGLHTGPEIKHQAELICRAAVGVGKIEAEDSISEVLVGDNVDPSAVQKRSLATHGVERLCADRVVGNPNADITIVSQRDDRREVGHRRGEVARAVNRVDDPHPSLANVDLAARLLAQHGYGWVFSAEYIGDSLLGRNIHRSDDVAATFGGNRTRRAKAAREDGAGQARRFQGDIDGGPARGRNRTSWSACRRWCVGQDLVRSERRRRPIVGLPRQC